MTTTTRPRVAVVAVHGVGHHEAGASASAVASLLLGLNAYSTLGGASLYSSFRTHAIDVPLPAPEVFRPPSGQRTQTPRWWSFRGLSEMFEERRGFFLDKYRLRSWFLPRTRREITAEIGQADIASEFMKIQLEDYRKDYKGDTERNSYSTCCIEGQCAPRNDHAETDVHIYEMHWSDLARPNSSFLSFFLAFYQLLLHITSLGRMAVDQAALEHVGQWDWFVFQRTYSYASRTLTLFVFILLVLLPVVVFSPLLLLLPEGPAAEGTVVGLLFVAALGIVLWRSLSKKATLGIRDWWPFVFIVPTLSVLLSAVLFERHPVYIPFALEAEWWVGALLVLFLVFFPKYDEVRNGAIQSGLCLTLAVLGGFIYCAAHAAGWTLHASNFAAQVVYLRTAAFQMIQWVFLALRVGWVLVIGFALLAALAEGICRWRLDAHKDALARARAAGRTGRFTLALPAVLLLLVTILLWSGIYEYTVSHLGLHLFQGVNPASAFIGVKDTKPAFVRNVLLSPSETDEVLPAAGRTSANWDADRFLDGLLFQSAPPGLPVISSLITVGFLLLVLMVLPSVYFEVNPPVSADNGAARRLGAWLSGGLNSFRGMIACFWFASFVVPMAYVLWVMFAQPSGFGWIPPKEFYSGWGMSLTYQMLHSGGTLLVGSAALLLGVLLKYLSSTLDIILDVDNYLRTAPAEDTPRARIVERYLALLNFLHAGGPDEKPYDRIIIVAHSLGALISADLLRYLTRNEMPELTNYAFRGGKRLPLLLFTMGNPLRQLLNRFFPVLYSWIRPCPDGSGTRSAAEIIQQKDSENGPKNPAQPTPTATELGVEVWWNSYRSGDYVGRSLWLDDWYARTDEDDDAGGFPRPPLAKEFQIASPKRIECCIGLGAHTHYWDRTAPDIAQQLDALILARLFV
jgi:hypothetical protein